MIDQVWLKILHSQLVNICEEMSSALMRTSYSPIFSEGLDFYALILDRRGDLVATAKINGAMLGQSLFSGRWVIDDMGVADLEPGDVVIHNDPYRGGSHMPEHLLITPFFYDGELQGFVGTIGHVAEIGGMAPGSFASNATEIYQEGLRLPPVKIVRGGEPVRDVWRIILANHRTPETSWGDLHALIGALSVGTRRLEALYDEHGADRVAEAIPALFDYSEAWMCRAIASLPQGTYAAEDCQEDDGQSLRPYTIRVDVTVDGDHLVVDYSRSDEQALGAINAPYVVTASGTYNGVLFVIGSDVPLNAGAVRPIDIIAPPGTMVNVRHPGPCVGGQTELQARLIELIVGRIFSNLLPDRTAAASGGTCSNFLFGGVHPRTGEYYTNYHLEGMGWGGRATTDGNNAQIVPHGNCRNTPIEVIETRYPWIHEEYRLNPDGGGAGRTRGGLGITRTLTVDADEIVVNAFTDRSRVQPWGLFGGLPGQCGAFLVRKAGEEEWHYFSQAFGTPSDTKFSNVRLRRGDQVVLRTPSGGGFGPPGERPTESVAADVADGFITEEAARELYGVVFRDGAVDAESTAARRRELAS
jgi:N-methylhydantoinase B/oxoprolinase/acetone carboxylase alpha subunit